MSKEKILVTTDLSKSARAGLRFAVQLASQSGSSLVFLHVLEVLRPTRWSETRYKTYIKPEIKAAKAILDKLVLEEYKAAGVKPGDYQCVVSDLKVSVHRTIVNQAKKMDVDYICLSTRGAGVIKRLLGTNASILLTTSPIPVFVVPHQWKRSPIDKVFYSSDFNDLRYELKLVKKFAATVKAPIDVFHYDYLLHVKENVARLEKIANRYKSKGVAFHFKRQNIEEPLSYRLTKDVKKTRSSIAVMFTKQNRGWYERIFLSSRSADLAFVTRVPLLIYRKRVA